MRSFLIAIALTACGSTPAKPVEPAAPAASSPAAAPATVAAAAPAAEVVVPLVGGGNAVVWDAGTSTLYLTDSNADALLRWTDHGRLETVGGFPAATGGVGLGDIVRRPDGTILVTSFGYGKQGTLFAMAPDHSSQALTGLEPSRRRIGLAQDASGVLYSAYFVAGGKRGDGKAGDGKAGDGKAGDGKRGNGMGSADLGGGRGMGAGEGGGVAIVAITGSAATETEIAGGSTGADFHKLVGIVAAPGAVFVSDQSQKLIYKIAVPGFAVSRLAEVPAVDLLAILPNGDLLTGGGSTISRITQDGHVTALPFTGFEQVRGLAYDPAGKRLFVINHSKTVGVPDKLHILPFAG